MTTRIMAENVVEGLVGGKRRRMWKSPPTFSMSPQQLHRFLRFLRHCQYNNLPVQLREQEVQLTSTKFHTHHKDTSTRPACKHRESNTLWHQIEALLSLRLSSVNNLGVEVLQETSESFKLCSHGDYCLISEWRSWGCSQEQELNVPNTDSEGFHLCISVFGVCCLCKM